VFYDVLKEFPPVMDIVFEHLYKAYGSKVIFDDISLHIERGSRCVLLGGSGTGKSQMLKHIVGLVRPDKGRIVIDGQDITKFSESKLTEVRKRIGYIFQNGGILDSLSVEQNVGLQLREHSRKTEKEILAEVSQVLGIVGLAGMEQQMPSTLSGGQRKRVAIARALTMDVNCFLFDEPTAGLDPMTSATVDDVILEINQKQKSTVLVVTHDLISMAEIAERVLFLHDHKIAFDGTVKEFYASEIPAVKAFLARDQHAIHPPTQSQASVSKV
jgi:phospholipid/cholesterol/gamma-HCH transport system ATP-binding protein